MKELTAFLLAAVHIAAGGVGLLLPVVSLWLQHLDRRDEGQPQLGGGQPAVLRIFQVHPKSIARKGCESYIAITKIISLNIL